MNFIPEKGDIVWIDFDPQAGHEQAGRRPGLVLTRSNYNARSGLFVVCPITTKSKGYPFEVKLPDGLPVSGVVLADQARSLDWKARSAEFAARAPSAIIDEVLAKLETLLFSN